ncbi:MAG TPA: hypothetical protein VNC78_03960 [Actinomycetota bacterium]|nr:hypothetical protein [Actinomycetota bacterium]
MSEFIGALHRLGVFTRQEVHLMIYDDALVIAVSQDAAALLGAAIGLGLGNVMAERMARRARSKSAADLAEEEAGNRLIPVDTVESAELHKAAAGLYRVLDLKLKDGTVESLKWQRGDNRDSISIPLFKKALGDRFVVAFEDAPKP